MFFNKTQENKMKSKEEIYQQISKLTTEVQFYFDEIEKFTKLNDVETIECYNIEIETRTAVLKTLSWVLGLSAIVINGKQIKVGK